MRKKLRATRAMPMAWLIPPMAGLYRLSYAGILKNRFIIFLDNVFVNVKNFAFVLVILYSYNIFNLCFPE